MVKILSVLVLLLAVPGAVGAENCFLIDSERRSVARVGEPAIVSLIASEEDEQAVGASVIRFQARISSLDEGTSFLLKAYGQIGLSEGMSCHAYLGTVAFFPIAVGREQSFVLLLPPDARYDHLIVALQPLGTTGQLPHTAVEVANATIADRR